MEEKYSTARVRSLSNSSSSSQIVRPLNSHWRERLEDRGEDDEDGGVTTPPVVVVVADGSKPIEDKGDVTVAVVVGGAVVVVDSIVKSSCSF